MTTTPQPKAGSPSLVSNAPKGPHSGKDRTPTFEENQASFERAKLSTVRLRAIYPEDTSEAQI